MEASFVSSRKLGSHPHIVAIAFRILGWLFGLPSLLLSLSIAFDLVALRATAPSSTTSFLDIGKYGLVGILNNVGVVVAKCLGPMIELADWLFGMIAVAAFVVSLCSLALYFIGVGIDKHEQWARVSGIIGSVLVLIVSCGFFSVLPRGWYPVLVLVILSTCYSAWVLVWKFG